MVDDLARLAGLFGVQVLRSELEQWAPQLRELFADLARLLDLPIEEREPAFLGAGGAVSRSSGGR